jgi:succinate-semialdehyde dehydrogenase/glutarate-semialdehyde dehydrogenase
MVPNGNADDALDAVATASTAYQDWRRVTGLERADMLQLTAQKIQHHFDEVVNILTLEEGKPISENEEEVEWVEVNP